MLNRTFTYLLLLFPLIWVSCDTSSSIDQPDYFVKYFGIEGDQEGVDMIANADGTFYLFGNSTTPGDNQKLFLVKADASGNMMWEMPRLFGGDEYTNRARDIELTTDGRLVMAATSNRDGGNNDVLLITTDLDGNKQDSVLYDIGGDEDVVGVTQISNGFIATGATTNVMSKPEQEQVVGDESDIFNLRFNNNLSIYTNAWSQTLGPGTYDAGVKIIEARPNLFYLFGTTNQRPPSHASANLNFYILQINNFGIPFSAPLYAGSSLADEQLTCVSFTSPEAGGGFFLTGISKEASGENNIFITRMVRELNSDRAGVNLDDNFFYQKNFSSSLGNISVPKVVSGASKPSGYFILANESTSGNQNFCLAKATNEGSEAWSNPNRFVFGSNNVDEIGAVVELPDGKIAMLGTFSVGDDGQKKMTLIKVNKDGKFRD